ncbi:MAG: phosphonoacetaldehyde reductase [Candidatus Limnocylindria bacterium]
MQTFHNPVRIRFGSGALDDIGELVGSRRCVVLTSEGMARRGELGRLTQALGGYVAATYTAVTPNPTIESATKAFQTLRGGQPEVELIVALGGGSVIDTAKAVAAQYANAGKADWLSAHLRHGTPFEPDVAAPAILAIPTTAGTGSEVTMWGTIWDEASGRKYSIAHPSLYPEHALLDPQLTLSVPRPTTVATALDALSHAMESIWNRSANPVSDALAMQAIGVIPGALVQALETPDNLGVRERLLAAALAAGLAMSNTRTALAHSISYPMTSRFGVPHGVACSLTLPEILRGVGETHPGRASLITEALGVASAADGADSLYALFRDVAVADVLSTHIPTIEALTAIEGELITPGRADNSLLPADGPAAAQLLRTAYGQVTA